ncbi:hypothetical protein ACL1BG_13205, partial [Corynebacterium striatum]
PNLTKRQTNQNQHHRKTTTLILNKAGKSKNYYTKKNHNHPQPTGQKKGAVKPQKMIHAISMHTKQINLIIYNRAPKGPIRHTPHQPNT